MYRQEAKEEYLLALRGGQKAYKLSVAAGENPYPAVLDEVLEQNGPEIIQEIGLVDIPAERIIGVKSAGRTTAFTANFLPLLGPDSEFAYKWVNLCEAHLSVGIRDPIICYEYLGNFYVQEGNKRVSVLRHMGAPRISAIVRRNFWISIKAPVFIRCSLPNPATTLDCFLLWGKSPKSSGKSGRHGHFLPISSISAMLFMKRAGKNWVFFPKKRCFCGCRCILTGVWVSCRIRI